MKAILAGDCIVVDSERIVPLGYFGKVTVAGREFCAVAFDTDEGWARGWFPEDEAKVCEHCHQRHDLTVKGKIEVEANEGVAVGD